MTLLSGVRRWPAWDILFPLRCERCGRPTARDDVLFCAHCWAHASFADPADYPRPPHVDRIAAAYDYSDGGFVQQVIHALKYDAMTGLAAELARRAFARVPRRYLESDVVWVPVPQHWARRMERSFNQSLVLTRALAEVAKHRRVESHLVRTRNTPTQTARTYRERAANVQGAFSLGNRDTAPRLVVLVDDVITTGATVNECARVLKKAGAEWVGAFGLSVAARPTEDHS